MFSDMVRRVGLWTASAAVLAVGFSALSAQGQTGTTADETHTPSAPTTSTGASFAPSHPVDCNDPNNAINCAGPNLDSPQVVGTAGPGSPFRD